MLVNLFDTNFKRSPTIPVHKTWLWCEEAFKEAFTNSLMTSRTSVYGVLNQRCSRDYKLLIPTFWPATIHHRFHLLIYYPAQWGRRQQQWSKGGKWLNVWNLPSSESSFFCWNQRNATNQLCRALWVREERGIKLQQT